MFAYGFLFGNTDNPLCVCEYVKLERSAKDTVPDVVSVTFCQRYCAQSSTSRRMEPLMRWKRYDIRLHSCRRKRPTDSRRMCTNITTSSSKQPKKYQV